MRHQRSVEAAACEARCDHSGVRRDACCDAGDTRDGDGNNTAYGARNSGTGVVATEALRTTPRCAPGCTER
jgi:hypothetical protein